jgi:HK97 family phage major capsid protein
MEQIEIKAAIEEQNKLFTDYKARIEKLEAKSTDPLADSAVVQMQTRLDELETKMNRPGASKGMTPATDEKSLAFNSWLRKGQLGPDEIKSMTVSDDTTGGYLAPAEYLNEIIKNAVQYDPIRGLARVRQTSSRTIQVPNKTQASTASWTGEGKAATESELKFGMVEMQLKKLTALVKVSIEDLGDSAFNLDGEISTDMSEQFGVAEGKAFLIGAGNDQPEGIMTNGSVASVNSGSATLITADGLMLVQDALKPVYQNAATWVMAQSTISAIRRLKDGTGNYIWQPMLADGTPSTILGKPYKLAENMPVIGANTYPVLYADFYRGYLIADRVQLAVQQLRELYAVDGFIGILAYKRVGGKVVLPEAIKKLKISA